MHYVLNVYGKRAIEKRGTEWVVIERNATSPYCEGGNLKNKVKCFTSILS